jgi:copper(I)-binding protein
MKRIVASLIRTVTLLTACAPREGIEVRDVWARTAAMGENGAVYFVIHNYSAEEDFLIGASSDVAETVDDVMQMEMMPEVLLSPGEDVEFGPGGLHVMLFNLKQELPIGSSLNLTLHFRNSPDISVTADVKAGMEHDDD